MAVAVELVGSGLRVMGSNPLAKDENKILAFRGSYPRLDQESFSIYRAGQWSLPKSYLDSSRRKVAINEGDYLHPVKAELEILGEVARNWTHWKGDEERHMLNVDTYIAGIHPELGAPFWNGQTPSETILGRLVIIEYDPRTSEPIVEVKDRLPKRNEDKEVRYCDPAGVESEREVRRHFVSGLNPWQT